MKRIIIISLVLAVMLLFTTWSFAGWNEGGFKNSPLFKYSLNEAVVSMENQADAQSSGSNEMEMATSKPTCPRAPETVHLCETTESTCEGNPTCYLGSCSGPTCTSPTCYGTCYGATCGGEQTCSGETCQTTCENTCQNTCSNCPPLVYGYVYHHAWGMPWTHNWSLYSTKQRYVFQYAPPYEIVGFNTNGWYSTREFGEPACGLIAKGEIWSQSTEGGPGPWGWHHYESVGTYKPSQDPGDEDQVDFNVQRPEE